MQNSNITFTYGSFAAALGESKFKTTLVLNLVTLFCASQDWPQWSLTLESYLQIHKV
jgi:hypothetical protein